METRGPIVFFDGTCGFCHGVVRKLAQADKRAVLKFAPLQSELAREMLAPHGLSPDDLDSVVLIADGRAFKKSAAAIHAWMLAGGWGKVAILGFIFPRFFRDFVYDLIAKNRHKIAGRHDACPIPSPEVRARFIGM